MTAYDVKEALEAQGVQKMITGRVKKLIDKAGGCEAFLALTDGEVMKLYNEDHPGSNYGLGKNTLEAIRLAKNHIRGVSDAARLDQQIAAERKEQQANAEATLKSEFLSGFESEPLEVSLLQEIAMSDLLKNMQTITIGELKFLMKMKRGGSR